MWHLNKYNRFSKISITLFIIIAILIILRIPMTIGEILMPILFGIAVVLTMIDWWQTDIEIEQLNTAI